MAFLALLGYFGALVEAGCLVVENICRLRTNLNISDQTSDLIFLNRRKTLSDVFFIFQLMTDGLMFQFTKDHLPMTRQFQQLS